MTGTCVFPINSAAPLIVYLHNIEWFQHVPTDSLSLKPSHDLLKIVFPYYNTLVLLLLLCKRKKRVYGHSTQWRGYIIKKRSTTKKAEFEL